MGKRDREKKAVRRLQLRREVIRILADDTLARVGGGLNCTGSKEGPDSNNSICVPSKDV
jgi:hypothetical protein